MTLETYLAFLAAAVPLILVPGPTNLVVFSTGMRAGLRASIWTTAGAALSQW